MVPPWLRFHIPLIEPDRQISRIRLSDKTSRLRPRIAAPNTSQTHKTHGLVDVRPLYPNIESGGVTFKKAKVESKQEQRKLF